MSDVLHAGDPNDQHAAALSRQRQRRPTAANPSACNTLRRVIVVCRYSRARIWLRSLANQAADPGPASGAYGHGLSTGGCATFDRSYDASPDRMRRRGGWRDGTSAGARQAASPSAAVDASTAAPEFPKEIGFTPRGSRRPRLDSQPAASGGRGREGRPAAVTAAPGLRSPPPELRGRPPVQLTHRRSPQSPARLTIVDTPSAVTMTNELGQSRTVHPDGKEETVEIQGVLCGVTSGETAIS